MHRTVSMLKDSPPMLSFTLGSGSCLLPPLPCPARKGGDGRDPDSMDGGAPHSTEGGTLTFII